MNLFSKDNKLRQEACNRLFDGSEYTSLMGIIDEAIT
jgi:hypothetical protein